MSGIERATKRMSAWQSTVQYSEQTPPKLQHASAPKSCSVEWICTGTLLTTKPDVFNAWALCVVIPWRIPCSVLVVKCSFVRPVLRHAGSGREGKEDEVGDTVSNYCGERRAVNSIWLVARSWACDVKYLCQWLISLDSEAR